MPIKNTIPTTTTRYIEDGELTGTSVMPNGD